MDSQPPLPLPLASICSPLSNLDLSPSILFLASRSSDLATVLALVLSIASVLLDLRCDLGFLVALCVPLFLSLSRCTTRGLYASKMIMRPERVTEEHLDPSLVQMDCRYDEGSRSGPGRVPGAAPADAGDVYFSQCDGAQSVLPSARGPCSRPVRSTKLQAVLRPVGGQDDLTRSCCGR
jgi:hypothetical protein